MSLRFTLGSDQYVDYGSASVFDNMTKRSGLFLINPATVAPTQAICVKGDGTSFAAYRSFYVAGINSGTIYIDSKRSVADLRAESGNILQTGVWQWVGFSSDEAGAASDQKLFYARLSKNIAEVGSYGEQTLGSGTFGDDAAFNVTVGNMSATVPQSWSRLDALVAVGMLWPRALTLKEFIEVQHSLLMAPGNVLFSLLGRQRGIQPDLSGLRQHGIVTGATQGPQAPFNFPKRAASYERLFELPPPAAVPMKRGGMFFGV